MYAYHHHDNRINRYRYGFEKCQFIILCRFLLVLKMIQHFILMRNWPDFEAANYHFSPHFFLQFHFCWSWLNSWTCFNVFGFLYEHKSSTWFIVRTFDQTEFVFIHPFLCFFLSWNSANGTRYYSIYAVFLYVECISCRWKSTWTQKKREKEK